jgi:hypothetical protein
MRIAMSIESSWQQIEAALEPHAGILSTLRPPISDADLQYWEDSLDVIPAALRRMHAIHDGAETKGFNSFSFIGNWTPLAGRDSVAADKLVHPSLELPDGRYLIPIAVDRSGWYLAVPPGDDKLFTAPLEAAPYPNQHGELEHLMSLTIEGLHGGNDDYRPELENDFMFWINREEEADDHDN